jgi:hypothetical protein
MGDAYGWTDNGRQVFDPVRLEQAAADLRKNNTAQQLREQLVAGLADPTAFGKLPKAPDASDRLRSAYDAMEAQLKRVGIDLADLASRALAAADLARQVDPVTQAMARRGHPGMM